MSPEASDLNSIGVVLVSNGEVFLKSDSGLRQVESGASVYPGEELVTGADSNVEIRFVDDTLLSQGPDSVIALDDYIFDSSDPSASSLFFKMSQGTFRMVTGKIAEQNPDRFQIGSPLATIGIRGTTTVHEISPGGQEKHGVEEIHSGKALLVQSIDGGIRVIDSPQALVDIAASGQMGTVRAMTVQEFNSFREIAPSAIRQEQEIREEQQEQDDQQDDQQTGQDGEGENGAGEAEGGETGIEQIPGEGVLDAGIGELIDSGLEGIELAGAVNEFVQGLAGEIFESLAQGDIETALQTLDRLENVTSEEDILELLETTKKTEIPPEAEGQTQTSGDGTNWILGTSGDDTWSGTEGTDYYKGLAGNDIINGLCGNDVLQGDEGNDTIEGGNGSDSIDGGDGIDFLSFGTETYSHGADVYLGDNSATVSGCDGTDIDSLINIEGVIGSSWGDTLSGSTGNNTLNGAAGDDLISGIGGSNLLQGGTGLDEIHGASGADTLYGGSGVDTLTGGGGDDIFYYSTTAPSEGNDIVTDFEHDTENDIFKFSSDGGFNSSFTFETVTNYDSSSPGGSGAYFIYETSTGKLYYDNDGTSVGDGLIIATVQGDAVVSADINVA